MKQHLLAASLALGLAGYSSTAQSAGPPAGSAAAGRFLDVIVTLDVDPRGQHADSNRALATAVARQHGLSPNFTYGAALIGFAARIPEALFDRLRADPLVKSIEIDREAHAFMGRPGGGGGGGGGEVVPWGVARVGGGLDASGVDIYIIDTGIDSDHPDLAASIAGGFAAVNCKGRNCNQAWDDDNGHGSHVAGSAAAIDNDIGVIGVAPGATLYAVKVLNSQGSGSFSGIISGIDWMTSQVQASGRPAVANMSLGGGGSKSGTCTGSGFSGSDSFHQAICTAKNAGVVFVVAAGNDGADAANAVPAAYDDAVITVSATNSSDDWPSWSNFGNDAASWTFNNSAPVAIAAPGVSILSTWNNGGTNTISGTSMASPHVAGGAALFLKSTPQQANGNAFLNARAALLNKAESTATFSNTSGKPHDEDFLDARGL